MGRQKKDEGAIVGSSIMLLQERFKQLQRVKEMREETQQQTMLMRQIMPHEEETHHPPSSSPSPSNQNYNYQHPLSLGLNCTPHDPNFHFPPPAVHNFFETHPPDVDTSLRL